MHFQKHKVSIIPVPFYNVNQFLIKDLLTKSTLIFFSARTKIVLLLLQNPIDFKILQKNKEKEEKRRRIILSRWLKRVNQYSREEKKDNNCNFFKTHQLICLFGIIKFEIFNTEKINFFFYSQCKMCKYWSRPHNRKIGILR